MGTKHQPLKVKIKLDEFRWTTKLLVFLTQWWQSFMFQTNDIRLYNSANPVFVERENKTYPFFFHPYKYIFKIGKNKFDRLARRVQAG